MSEPRMIPLTAARVAQLEAIGRKTMSETKHTPGPWVVTDATPQAMRRCELGENGWEPVGRQENQFLCVLRDSNRFQEPDMPAYGAVCALPVRSERARADARLIAAAPDLLEACKAALVTLSDDDLYERCKETYKTLEAALARVEGPQEEQ